MPSSHLILCRPLLLLPQSFPASGSFTMSRADNSSGCCTGWWGFLDPRFTKLTLLRTSLVVQWLRIQLPMQGTQVQSLDQEDATCCRASKPVHRNSLSASSLRSATREAAAVRSSHTDEEQPPLAEMRESLRVAMKTQNNQKLNLKHQPALNGSNWSVPLSSGGT